MPFSLMDAAFGATAVAAASIAAFVVSGRVGDDGPLRHFPPAETLEIAPGAFDFPPPGEYLLEGRPVAPALDRVAFDRPLHIMKYLVSLAEYRRCADAGACKPADAARPARELDAARIPATGVSHIDAEACARWYSKTTGDSWRLPTSAEWAYAARERFVGDWLPEAEDPDNPAIAWIRRYQEEAAARRKPDPLPRPRGFYGPNSNGIEDLAGNVWEWTATCYVRATLEADRRRVRHVTENCGVRVAEGRHRAYISSFIRDGKSGGCAVGVPPDNLGFRLVREESAIPVLARLRDVLFPGPSRGIHHDIEGL